MTDRAWKKRERQVAQVFGTRRRPGSGAWRRGEEGSDDAIHPTLYIEVKSGRTDPGSTLFERTEPRAKKAGKEAVTVYLPYRSPVGLCMAEMRLSTLARLLLPDRRLYDPRDGWPHPHQEPDPVVSIRLRELQAHTLCVEGEGLNITVAPPRVESAGPTPDAFPRGPRDPGAIGSGSRGPHPLFKTRETSGV